MWLFFEQIGKVEELLLNIHWFSLRESVLIDVPNPNTTIIWTPILEWFVATCRSTSGQQNDEFVKETGLRGTENMLTILSSIVNTIRRTYVTT